MKKPLTIYAVCCKDGHVHEDDEYSLIATGKNHMEDALAAMDPESEADCGPHRIATLIERRPGRKA